MHVVLSLSTKLTLLALQHEASNWFFIKIRNVKHSTTCSLMPTKCRIVNFNIVSLFCGKSRLNARDDVPFDYVHQCQWYEMQFCFFLRLYFLWKRLRDNFLDDCYLLLFLWRWKKNSSNSAGRTKNKKTFRSYAVWRKFFLKKNLNGIIERRRSHNHNDTMYGIDSLMYCNSSFHLTKE